MSAGRYGQGPGSHFESHKGLRIRNIKLRDISTSRDREWLKFYAPRASIFYGPGRKLSSASGPRREKLEKTVNFSRKELAAEKQRAAELQNRSWV